MTPFPFPRRHLLGAAALRRDRRGGRRRPGARPGDARPPRHRRRRRDRRGGLHLRPADRDELRGDVRIRHRPELRPVQGAVQPDLERGAASSPGATPPSPTPNSDTPYSMCWLDLRAEPVVVSVPDVPAGRYFSVQVCDGNTYNVGYIGSRATGQGAGRWLVAGPGLAGRDAARRQGRDPLHHAVRAGDLPHPAVRPRRHAERRRGPARLPGAAALGLPAPARAAGRRPRSAGRASTRSS